ncbi:MAG: Endoribonuclease YbeY [Planctomycetes bacterium]|nr:Endoribonuclease YbeY [Planctomycetota bacterium]
MPTLLLEISSSSRTALNARLARQALRLALGKTFARAEVSLRLVGDLQMRRLNRAALNHDYTTDVLSFDHGDSPEGRLLELIVCPAVARREARRRGLPPEQELLRYVVHGALHLAGHDDLEPGARQRMWQVQERLLKRLFKSHYRPQDGRNAWR